MSKLVKCPFCAEQIQAAAMKCRHCGEFLDKKLRKKPVDKPNPVATAGKSMLGCGVGLVIVAACFVFACSGIFTALENVELKPWDETDNSTMALVMAEDFVEQNLKSPSTADFKGVFSGAMDGVEQLPGHQYRVRSWVDSQNGFGATIRTHFTVVLEQTSEDNWKLISLDTDP